MGLLLIRLATGLIFLTHGWMKIQDTAMVSGMLMHMGVAAPSLFGPFISWLEVIGGLALILGVLTRPFAVALGIEMLFAIFLTGLSNGFGPHDLEFILMMCSFGIALAGSGRYAIWKMECKNCGAMLCDSQECPGSQD